MQEREKYDFLSNVNKMKSTYYKILRQLNSNRPIYLFNETVLTIKTKRQILNT